MNFLKKARGFTRALHNRPTTKVCLLRCGFKRNFTDLITSRDFPDRTALYNADRKNTTSENTAAFADLECFFSKIILNVRISIFKYLNYKNKIFKFG